MVFLSHGVRVGIRVSSPEILDRIKGVLPLHSKPARGHRVNSLYSLIVSGTKVGSRARRFNILYAEAKRLARTGDTDEALEALEDHLQLYVAEHAPRRVFVHAGVVGWRGKAIVIPGRTMMGKSTLVKALVEAGATYYSDEYAVLDKRGRVHPYARPLSMRPIGGGPPTKIPPEDLGGRIGVRPLPVGWIVPTYYRPDVRWRPRSLSPGRAVMELLAHTLPARLYPERVMPTLCAATVEATVLKGARGEAGEFAEVLLGRLTEQVGRGS